jgi:dihydropyrimidinase
MKTLVRHGRAVLPEGIEPLDILVEDGQIAALLPPGTTAVADQMIDAAGCYVLPGFIDFHVHLDDRIGPFYLADTYGSGSRVALQNGITTLCSFVTQGAEESLIQALNTARRKAHGTTHTDVLWHLTPTRFEGEDWTNLEALAATGYRTYKFYTTYQAAGIFADQQRLDEVFRRLGPLGARFLVHCEDDDVMAAVDAEHLDLSAPGTHGRLRPEFAELLAVEALLDLALHRRVPLHVVHVSTVTAAEILLRARGSADVTCETCPQYLWLDETWLDRPDGHRWLCSPPLRGSRERLRELARAGAFDLLATDHCAFRKQDKDAWDHRDVRTAANGIAGLGALPHLAWKLWADTPDRAALELAKRLSQNPARRAGIEDRKGALRVGLDADLVVLDPTGPETPLVSSLADVHETYPGFTSNLTFRHVLLRGEPVAADGRLLHPQSPTGILLQPQP